MMIRCALPRFESVLLGVSVRLCADPRFPEPMGWGPGLKEREKGEGRPGGCEHPSWCFMAVDIVRAVSSLPMGCVSSDSETK